VVGSWCNPNFAKYTQGREVASKCVSLGSQVLTLFMLAIPIASVAWTVTHEAILREARDYCKAQSTSAQTVLRRKFFYLFTCEYCFSHYVTALFLVIARFRFLLPGWRGYLLSLFALVWIANQYMSIYDRLRLNIKHEHISIDAHAQQLESAKKQGEKSTTATFPSRKGPQRFSEK
jgi:hypothetical protein